MNKQELEKSLNDTTRRLRELVQKNLDEAKKQSDRLPVKQLEDENEA